MDKNSVRLTALQYAGKIMNQQQYSLFGSPFWATPVNQQKLEEETQRRSNELAKDYERRLQDYEMTPYPIRLAVSYTQRRIDRPHNSLFDSSNSLFGRSDLPTPTQKLEQETQRRSQELAKEYEITLNRYNNFIQRRF
ncbi:hypothetical protein [Nostoc sp. CCY 9925]|uniref:hypothetical protein n=1 Tax=Nostoc sp. CCY 9925 TaxID=3103865 RepID=UPI0039C74A83